MNASVLSVFFAWPGGGVWSNLLASVLWGAPAFVTHHVLMRRHQASTARAQTEELKAHIDTMVGGPQA